MIKLQRYFLLLVFFSISFEQWDPFNTGIDFITTKITVVLYLLFTLFNIKYFYSFSKIKIFIYPIFGFFILLSTMNFLNRSANYNVYFDLPLFLNLTIMLAIINHTKKDPEIILKGFFAFSIATIVLTLMYLMKIGINYNPSNRVTIFGYNENELGILLSTGMLILNSLILENKLNLSKRRYLLYLMFPFMFLFMIETGSRVAFISFVLGIMIYWFLRKNNNLIKNIISSFFVIIVSLVIWGYFLRDSLIIERLFASAKEGDLSGRDVRWLASIDIFLNNPILGVGETGFSDGIENILGFYSSPHNVLIEVLCYTGIFGGFLFSFFLIKIIKLAWLSNSNERGSLAIILLIPVFGMLLSGQIFTPKISWIIFAYIISTVFIINNKLVK